MDAPTQLVADVGRRMRGVQLPAAAANEALGQGTHPLLVAEAQGDGANLTTDTHPNIAGRVHVDIGDGGTVVFSGFEEQVECAESVELRAQVAQGELPVDGYVFDAGVAPRGSAPFGWAQTRGMCRESTL